MMPCKLLVTGGAGFIGSHLVDALLAAGNQVVVLDNLLSGKIENLNLSHPNIEFIEGDVLEYPLIEDLLTGCDAIIHLAAVASVQQSIENPIYSLQVNVQGFLHVLEAVRNAKWPVRVVYASSAAVYGNTKELPARESSSITSVPLSPYALHKLDNEKYAAIYAALHGVRNVGLRFFNVYGSRQDPSSMYSGVISRFIDAYKRDAELTIFGDGSQSRDFIHVSDVVKAMMLAIESAYTGVLNVATGKPQTLLNLIECIESAGKHPAKIRFEPTRIGDIHDSYADVSQAKQILDFQAALSLKEGIGMMV